jgi:hypothetical protein
LTFSGIEAPLTAMLAPDNPLILVTAPLSPEQLAEVAALLPRTWRAGWLEAPVPRAATPAAGLDRPTPRRYISYT